MVLHKEKPIHCCYATSFCVFPASIVKSDTTFRLRHLKVLKFIQHCYCCMSLILTAVLEGSFSTFFWLIICFLLVLQMETPNMPNSPSAALRELNIMDCMWEKCLVLCFEICRHLMSLKQAGDISIIASQCHSLEHPQSTSKH